MLVAKTELAKNRDDFFDFVCNSHLLKEITTSHSASAPRNDRAETKEITTSHSASAPRNDDKKTTMLNP